MNLNRTQKQRAWAAGALVAPVLLAAATRIVLNAGPSVSAAGTAAVAADAPPPAPSKPPTAEQVRAMQWLAGAARARAERSPMLHLKAPEPAATPAAAAQAEPERAAERPAMALSAVLTRDGRVTALINGRLRGVGDEVAPGWTIEAIDGDALSVTVRGPDGQDAQIRGRR